MLGAPQVFSTRVAEVVDKVIILTRGIDWGVP
jgi:hypothetical protein